MSAMIAAASCPAKYCAVSRSSVLLFQQSDTTQYKSRLLHLLGGYGSTVELLAGGIEPTLIVILPDINMPGMDGLTLLGEIKQRFPDLPVMMVTAYGDDERCRKASELGAAEFLTKPVDFDQLKAELLQLSAAADYSPCHDPYHAPTVNPLSLDSNFPERFLDCRSTLTRRVPRPRTGSSY
jgi:CheY-like chemotaxis protein